MIENIKLIQFNVEYNDLFLWYQSYATISIKDANSALYVVSKVGNQKSKTDSELNSEIRFNRIRIRFGKFGIDISFQHISNTEVALG